MISEREFLILSTLAYVNFERKHIGREIKEIFENRDVKLEEESNVKILRFSNIPITMNYFSREIEGWRILHIENRRAQSKSIFNKGDKSGFYAVSFEKNGKVVISFRGSETFPIEEAYKDFVENNFALGIGKRPKQFNDAAYVIDYHIKFLEISKENIFLTGHSLGGGLAQFAALYANKNYDVVPFTSTWNAVGINRNGVIQIQDFLNFDEILEKKLHCSKKVIEALKPFRDEYLKILSTFETDGNMKLISFLESESRARTLLEGITKKIYLTSSERTDFIMKIIDTFFIDGEILNLIKKAQKFMEDIKENTVYMGKIKNFGHSKDLTNSIFNHVGGHYLVDTANALKKKIENSSVVRTIFTKKKSITSYHFEDVFVPYMKEKGEGEEVFSDQLHWEFIASVLRRLIYEEKGFKPEFLGEFYSNIELNEENYSEVKKQMLDGIKKTELHIIYQENIITVLETMGIDEFKEIWERTFNKLPSPFVKRDIYDVLVY